MYKSYGGLFLVYLSSSSLHMYIDCRFLTWLIFAAVLFLVFMNKDCCF